MDYSLGGVSSMLSSWVGAGLGGSVVSVDVTNFSIRAGAHVSALPRPARGRRWPIRALTTSRGVRG